MRRPYGIAIGILTASVGIYSVTADAGYTPPVPPTTTDPDSRSGSCTVEGHGLPVTDAEVDHLILFQNCWTSNESDRPFDVTLDSDLLVFIHDFVEFHNIERTEDDEIVVH